MVASAHLYAQRPLSPTIATSPFPKPLAAEGAGSNLSLPFYGEIKSSAGPLLHPLWGISLSLPPCVFDPSLMSFL